MGMNMVIGSTAELTVTSRRGSYIQLISQAANCFLPFIIAMDTPSYHSVAQAHMLQENKKFQIKRCRDGVPKSKN